MRPPRFPYQAIAERILPGWEVSLAFAPASLARALNKKLRNKSYTPNVLSYTAGAKHGEVIICLEVAKQQAPKYGMGYQKFVLFLFIHGLLHLEGRRHGTTMERREQALLKKFSAPARSYGSTHRYRNRHRDLSGQGGRRRGGPR